MKKNQDEIRQLFEGVYDRAGNLADLPSIYPDQSAPIVRNCEDGRELVQARWGMPTPRNYLEGKNFDKGVTNVRNTSSRHWQQWFDPTYRCLVPFTSFSEPTRGDDGKSRNVWFDFGEGEPLAFFAGIHVPQWTSVRKVSEGEVTTDLFAFLTTAPNAEVGEVHPKAMPVILREKSEWEAWLTLPWTQAAVMQKALPDRTLRRHLPPPPAQGSLF